MQKTCTNFYKNPYINFDVTKNSKKNNYIINGTCYII